jgi:hypothetical protein
VQRPPSRASLISLKATQKAVRIVREILYPPLQVPPPSSPETLVEGWPIDPADLGPKVRSRRWMTGQEVFWTLVRLAILIAVLAVVLLWFRHEWPQGVR